MLVNNNIQLYFNAELLLEKELLQACLTYSFQLMTDSVVE